MFIYSLPQVTFSLLPPAPIPITPSPDRRTLPGHLLDSLFYRLASSTCLPYPPNQCPCPCLSLPSLDANSRTLLSLPLPPSTFIRIDFTPPKRDCPTLLPCPQLGSESYLSLKAHPKNAMRWRSTRSDDHQPPPRETILRSDVKRSHIPQHRNKTHLITQLIAQTAAVRLVT